MTIRVCVAYADLYVGTQLCREFACRPHAYTVYACTWHDVGTPPRLACPPTNTCRPSATLPSESSHAYCTSPPLVDDSGRIANDGVGDANVRAADVAQQTHKTAVAARKQTMAQDDIVSVSTAMETTATAPPSSPPAPAPTTTTTTMRTTTTSTGTPSTRTCNDHTNGGTVNWPRAHYFWRKDVAELRHALRVSQWIVVVLRDAQDVFDILSHLELSATTQHKRLVLVSNFMTWFATPSLTSGRGSAYDQHDKQMTATAEAATTAAAAAVGLYEQNSESAKAIAAMCIANTDECDDDDDIDGDDNDDNNNNNNNDASSVGDHTCTIDDGVPLTEDQYNRRVPHIQYYNWRDAERAVACAHHADGRPLDTFVVFSGLAYGEGEGALQPFFRQAWSSSSRSVRSSTRSVSGRCGSGGVSDCDNGADTRRSGSANDDKLYNTGIDEAAVHGACFVHRNATAARNTVLPIFGSGKQRIPMIHVRDLATFTRKLLRTPLDELPQPRGRYIFATDNASTTWLDIVRTIRDAFGGMTRCVRVRSNASVRYRDVEQFTIDLHVSNATTQEVMARDDDDDDDDDDERDKLGSGDDKVRGGTDDGGDGGGDRSRNSRRKGHNKDGNTVASADYCRWVARDGFAKCKARVAHEFRATHKVQPLRIVIAGPPLAGKTLLSTHLSDLYDIPAFGIADIVCSYQRHLQRLRAYVTQYCDYAYARELQRRVSDKMHRHAQQRVRVPTSVHATRQYTHEDEESTAAMHAPSHVVRGDDKGATRADADVNTRASHGAHADDDDDNNNNNNNRGKDVDDDDDGDVDEQLCCTLTSEEKMVARGAAEATARASHKVQEWQQQVAQMERVLLMRVRPRATTPDVNPKRRNNNNNNNAPRKKLTREQQRKRDDDDLHVARAATTDAPLHDKALAIMVRWRLEQPDCRNQGYILDGFPCTVEQCRLCFGAADVAAPRSDEEALYMCTTPEWPNGAQPHNSGSGNTAHVLAAATATASGGGDDGNSDLYTRLNAVATTELCDEQRLPDFFFLLQASEQQLQARFAAVTTMSSSVAASVQRTAHEDDAQVAHATTMTAEVTADHADTATTTTTATLQTTPVTQSKRAVQPHPSMLSALQSMQERTSTSTKSTSDCAKVPVDSTRTVDDLNTRMHAFANAFVQHEYTVPNFYESAVTVSTKETQGGRRVAVHTLATDNKINNTTMDTTTTNTTGAALAKQARNDAAPQHTQTINDTVASIIGRPHNFQESAVQKHVRNAKQAYRQHIQCMKEMTILEQDQSQRQAARESEQRSHMTVVKTAATALCDDVVALSKRKTILQTYVQKCIMPTLSKGLRDVCDAQPQQPVLYLAQWLQNHNPHHDMCNDV